MNDYRIEIRVKNARLHDAIHAKFKSIKDFCDKTGVAYVSVCELVRMGIEARTPSTGKWREISLRVSDALGEFPDDLFNERQQFGKQLEKIKAINVSEQAIGWIKSRDLDPELIAHDDSMKSVLAKAIATLPKQSRSVISKHVYEDKTCEEISRDMDLSRGRIQQILLDGIMKLRKSLSADDFDCGNDSSDETMKRRRYANFPSWKACEEELAAIG